MSLSADEIRLVIQSDSGASGHLSLDKSKYDPGEEIEVRFEISSGHPSSAWVGIIPSGIAHGSEAENDKNDLTYQYLRDRNSGTLTFNAPQELGSYDLRMHDSDDSGKEIASVTFTVRIGKGSLWLDKNLYEPTEEINVHFEASEGYPSDAWVGIVPADIPHGSEVENDKHDLAYQYLEKKTSGTLIFQAPQEPGSYSLRMHNTDSNGKEVADVSFSVQVAKGTLSPDKAMYEPGEEIEVDFKASEYYSTSGWVGIVPASVPHGSEAENDKHDLTYQYLEKKTSGTLIFQAPQEPGSYDLRMHDTDSNGREVASVSFSVQKSIEPGVIEDQDHETGIGEEALPSGNTSNEMGLGVGSANGGAESPSNQTLINTSEWGEVVSNQVLVVLKEGRDRSDAERVATSLGGKITSQLEYINLYQIDIENGSEEDLREALNKAKQNPDVLLAFPNQPGQLDIEVRGIQCSPLDDSTYEGDRGRDYEIIGVQNAWDLMRVSGLPLSDVHVGVVDNGLYKGQGEFDGKSVIDTSEANSELAAPLDPIAGSHGTGVMSIIAADPDNGGVVGIASQPLGKKLTVSMVNNFDPPDSDGHRHCYPRGSMAAIEKAVHMNAKVISCSWGATDIDEGSAAAFKLFFEKMAADHPDVLFVCSAGNDGRAINGSRRWPSGLNLSNMITVGNIMNDGIKAQKSNMISDNYEVTLAAPGEQAVYGFNNQGAVLNENGGTSMATPQVTSAAALLLSMNPALTPAEIKAILMDTSREGVTLGTPKQADWMTVPAPGELGGRVLAIDQAVLKVINDQRGKNGLKTLDMDEALALARVDLKAKSDPAIPQDWKVTAQIGGVEKGGADVAIELQGEGAIGTSTRQHLGGPGSLSWDVTAKGSATVEVTRLDTGGCSRAYLGEEEKEESLNWLENINPADYMLLASDLKSPFSFGMDIYAEANSWAYEMSTDKGLEWKNVSYLYSQQTIDIEGMPEGQSGDALWLQVMVFETPEIAIEYCKETLKDYAFNQETLEGYSPGYNGMKDPRLDGGVGASSDDSKFVQYKNAVIRIEEIGSVDDVSPYIPQLAKLWIDKVSQIR